MIIHELTQLAHREDLLADEAYGPQKIHYLISIDSEGRYLGMTSTLEPPANGRGKPQPKLFSLPSPLGRKAVNVQADLLWGNAKYLFGRGDLAGEKLRERAAAFRQLLRTVHDATRDAGIAAVLKFLERYDEDPGSLPLHEVSDDAFFTFTDPSAPSELLSSRPAIRAYWQSRRIAAAAASEHGCIVCGSTASIVRNHPEIKNVPGGNPAGVALVSFNNAAAWSFGFTDEQRHLNAPFCRTCADAYTRALNRLLAPPPGFPSPHDPNSFLPVQNYRLSGDTVALFWASQSAFGSIFTKLLNGDVDSVRALLDSPRTGRTAVDVTGDRFFAIVLSGAQGRAVLRSTLATTVDEVQRNLKQHFEDLNLVAQYPNEPQFYPLWDLLCALKAPGKGAAVAPALLQDVFEAAILGRLYPMSLLDASLRRLRSGDPFTRTRISLIKAVLNRRWRVLNQFNRHKEITMALDSENRETGYRLGRLFAVLERLQGDAINNPNATIVDRYYGAASTTPVVVFSRLLGLAQHHAAKSERGGFFQKLIEEITWGLDPDTAFPSSLDLEQQGLFALGYYHQRADLWKKKEAPASADKGGRQ